MIVHRWDTNNEVSTSLCTGGIQTVKLVNYCAQVGYNSEVSKSLCTGGIQTVKLVKYCAQVGYNSEVSKSLCTRGIQTEVSKMCTGGIQTEVSKLLCTGGIQTVKCQHTKLHAKLNDFVSLYHNPLSYMGARGGQPTEQLSLPN